MVGGRHILPLPGLREYPPLSSNVIYS